MIMSLLPQENIAIHPVSTLRTLSIGNGYCMKGVAVLPEDAGTVSLLIFSQLSSSATFLQAHLLIRLYH